LAFYQGNNTANVDLKQGNNTPEVALMQGKKHPEVGRTTNPGSPNECDLDMELVWA
jgi:hypothetical protein